MKTKLVAVQGCIQLIAAYISSEYLRKSSGNCDDKYFLLIYDLMVPQNQEPIITATIKKLSAIRNWHNIIFINSSEMNLLNKGPISSRILALHSILGCDYFDEIYLARDFIGQGSPLIINSYPDSKKILYGDSLGVVLTPQCVSITPKFSIKSLATKFKAAFKSIFISKFKKIKFDNAILTLPIDVSGKGLISITLLVPDKTFVMQCLHAFIETVNDADADHDLLYENKNLYLVLLSNLSAAGFMSEKNELALYIEIILENIPRGSVIFLKNHPRSNNTTLTYLSDFLKDYIVITSHGELEKYPVELWDSYLNKCSFIPIFSGSAINVKYLHNINPIFTLDDNKIKKFFYEDKLPYISRENKMIIEATNMIDIWDGVNVIWSGKPLDT